MAFASGHKQALYDKLKIVMLIIQHTLLQSLVSMVLIHHYGYQWSSHIQETGFLLMEWWAVPTEIKTNASKYDAQIQNSKTHSICFTSITKWCNSQILKVR